MQHHVKPLMRKRRPQTVTRGGGVYAARRQEVRPGGVLWPRGHARALGSQTSWAEPRPCRLVALQPPGSPLMLLCFHLSGEDKDRNDAKVVMRVKGVRKRSGPCPASREHRASVAGWFWVITRRLPVVSLCRLCSNFNLRPSLASIARPKTESRIQAGGTGPFRLWQPRGERAFLHPFAHPSERRLEFAFVAILINSLRQGASALCRQPTEDQRAAPWTALALWLVLLPPL